MAVQVNWTPEGLREFTLWIAAFARDEIALRVYRKFHLEAIKKELNRTNGRPSGGYAVTGPNGGVVVWEYAARELWLVFRRGLRRATFLQRLRGRADIEVLIVEAIRRPPTLQELRSLPG